MAAKFRGLGRLLFVVWVMLGSGVVWGEEYYSWKSKSGSFFKNPFAACANEWSEPNYTYSTAKINIDGHSATCIGTYAITGAQHNLFNVYRYGSSCEVGSNYDKDAGECLFPKDCSSTAGKETTASVICDLVKPANIYACPSDISLDGCGYIKTFDPMSCVTDLETGVSTCTAKFVGSGDAVAPNTPDLPDESATKPKDPSEPSSGEQCVTNGSLTICQNDQPKNDDGSNSNCGTVNGQSGCFQEKPGCGFYNGTYQCIEADKPQKNCGYFNGKLACTDPKDPTKIIPETSPDHPKNGGNADGNPNNDPKAPSTDGSAGDGKSPQGSDEGATNEAVDKLGDKLGEKADKTNELLGEIKGQLEKIQEGGEYDGSANGNPEGIAKDGAEQGDKLGSLLGDKFGEAIEGIDSANEEYLKETLPDLISGEKGWFNDNSPVVRGLDFINDIMPQHSGCSDYTINLSLGRYSTRLVIPVCQLSKVKPLLETVIWLITAIALWKIFYSGLRLEDAKASRGGF